MKIDIYTIQVFLLFLTATFTVTWGVLWRSYPHVPGIPAWISATVLMILAAVGIMNTHPEGTGLVSIGAHVIAAFAMCMLWIGIRQFYGFKPPWIETLVITLATMLGIVAAGENGILLNLAYSLSAVVPFALIIKTLFRRIALSPAARLCAISMAVAIVGQTIRIGGAIAFSMEVLPDTITRPIGLFAVLSIIFGLVTCQLGFMLAVMEHVRFELSSLVVVDELTGLSSRRHFLERLNQACASTRRVRRPFCLLVIDLDGFKSINDAHGHAAGDQCLRRFGEVASMRMRRTDVIGRIGGDEFSVIMPDTRLTDALRVAEDLRRELRAQPVIWKGSEIVVAASIGITEWDPQRLQTPAELVADADQALYQAKCNGRDRVAYFPISAGVTV